MDTQAKRRVLCLAGPTGAGKTALAIRLATTLGCEIVNADSRQVYADFPIITAQPSAEEQAQASHHLYGFLSTEATIDVQSWMDLALGTIDNILARGRIPLLVGGTGMYFERLLHGIADIPAIDSSLHARLEDMVAREGAPALHALLQERDPVLARRLHPNDRQRIVRGLEVAMGTAHPLSWWQQHAHRAPSCEGPLLVVNTSLARLEPGLAARIDKMLAHGALDEAKRALARCQNPKAPGWSGIGCRELFAFLAGSLDLAAARELWLKNTRAYAKRQITWFRGRAEAVWIGADDLDAALRTWEDFCAGGEAVPEEGHKEGSGDNG